MGCASPRKNLPKTSSRQKPSPKSAQRQAHPFPSWYSISFPQSLQQAPRKTSRRPPAANPAKNLPKISAKLSPQRWIPPLAPHQPPKVLSLKSAQRKHAPSTYNNPSFQAIQPKTSSAQKEVQQCSHVAALPPFHPTVFSLK